MQIAHAARIPADRIPRAAITGGFGRGGLTIQTILELIILVIDNILVPILRFFEGLSPSE